jgi:hypothetical protein
MTSNNPKVISSIIALDSFGEFENLSKRINKIRSDKGLIPEVTTILSDIYQRTKYINAVAGKDGVGMFSLDSTFNASIQGKELVYLNFDEEVKNRYYREMPYNEVIKFNSVLTRFGDIESKGDLSNEYTLRSQKIIEKAKRENRELTNNEEKSLKFKSTIIRSLQSSAVDNEKAQILDKLNINVETFDTIRALTILGFEEEDIVGLITQEIIWEYIEKLRNTKSSLSEYTENSSTQVVEELISKYDPSDKYITLSQDEIERLNSVSGKELLKNIEDKSLVLNPIETPDTNLQQIALLNKFLYLQEIGKNIKQVQSAINTESKGVPKSLLEVDTKVRQINNINSNIHNVTKLLGEYDEDGLISPTTLNGYASFYGSIFTNNLL